MKRHFRISHAALVFVFVLHLSHGEVNNTTLTGSLIYQADSLYAHGEYSQALQKYRQLDVGKMARSDDVMKFRMAYAFYRTSQFDSSVSLFKDLWRNRNFLPEYCQYFYIRSLWHINMGQAVLASERFVHNYSEHALGDSFIVQIADYYYSHRYYEKARAYYLMAIKPGLSADDRANHAILAAKALYFQNKREEAKKEFTQILRKYPANKFTLELVILLKVNEKEYYDQQFFNVVNVYYQNTDYDELRKEIESYISREKDVTKIEKARYYLIKIYYALGRSRTALYGFSNLLKQNPDPKMEPYIRIYIARCYYKLGQKKVAIESYLDYADRYPRRRNAPEAVWKCARILEESADMKGAVELYRKIKERWPNSGYARNAYFREGFLLFGMHHFEDAARVFDEIRRKNWPDIDTDRAQYWLAKCYEVLDKDQMARDLRVELAENLWDNYYTLKSYLLHKSFVDEKLDIIRQFQNSADGFKKYSARLANFMPYFEEAFLIKDLLGIEYGLIALSEIELQAKSMEEWAALAELFKKFGNYGRAYQIYDYIDSRFFSDMPYVEKAFIIKERFPFYYEKYIDEYSVQFGVEKELILSVIKQESTFRHQVVSRADAWGLMQLIPATAKNMAKLTGTAIGSNEELFNPEINIMFGAFYLKQLEQMFSGQKEYILAAYNAGPHRVKRWKEFSGSNDMDNFIENIEYTETRNYVRRVMKNYWAYKLLSTNFQTDHPEVLLGLRPN